MDLVLPDGDGLSLLERIRTDARLAGLPVIVVSAVAEGRRSLLMGGSLKVVDVQSKPLAPNRLLAALDMAAGALLPRLSTILHADQDPASCARVARLLAGNVELFHAHSVADACRVLADNAVDVVLLDDLFPDGQAADILRHLADMPHAPAGILFTDEDHRAEVSEQVDAVFNKQRLNREALARTLALVLDSDAQQAASDRQTA